MDFKTQQFYSENSAQLADKYNSCLGGISAKFAESFKSGMKVLDIGCGSGQDMRILQEMGFQVDGVFRRLNKYFLTQKACRLICVYIT